MMTRGIYCYIDKKTNKIVYVGKDSYINRNMRHKAHYRKSLYNDQPINKILQNNLDRYEYRVLEEGDFSEKELNNLEINYISRYNPFFNFTKGGDGALGYKHTEERKKFFSKNNPMKSPKQRERMRKDNPMKNPDIVNKMLQTKRERGYFKPENNPMYGKHHSEETKRKISVTNKGRTYSEEEKNQISLSVSKSRNTSGYYRVVKERSKRVNQGFLWTYSWVDKDKKRKKLQSIDIEKLRKKVEARGLPWFKMDTVS